MRARNDAAADGRASRIGVLTANPEDVSADGRGGRGEAALVLEVPEVTDVPSPVTDGPNALHGFRSILPARALEMGNR